MSCRHTRCFDCLRQHDDHADAGHRFYDWPTTGWYCEHCGNPVHGCTAPRDKHVCTPMDEAHAEREDCDVTIHATRIPQELIYREARQVDLERGQATPIWLIVFFGAVFALFIAACFFINGNAYDAWRYQIDEGRVPCENCISTSPRPWSYFIQQEDLQKIIRDSSRSSHD